MSLVKRNPDNWLPSVFDDMFKTDWMGGTTNLKGMVTQVPPVNIQENADNFLLELAAPGKGKKDFNIEVDNDVLTISSEEKTEKETKEENGKYTRREYSYSNFKRAFTLPESVNAEGISATYENGVLNILLPKREEAKVQPKRLIEIK